MVIEYAREVAKIKGASSTEFEPTTTVPVIATMAEQIDVVEGKGDLGGTMRLGSYPAELTPGSVAAITYNATTVHERHRHRYEFNNKYKAQLEKAGLVFSGTSPNGDLVEFVELPTSVHPYYISTQAHPEFLSRPHRAHPLFAGLVEAALHQQAQKQHTTSGERTEHEEILSSHA
ncbi:CTP synthase [Platysternon megacephalum]|uniref:CTP synthase (glutamine hydrolyzing) n=1 Tax=Platysternon megacephalum TaxID=55544 RepID=A0A4D9DAX7_9SAUR|nr:CTP synthase [Platysternon megacephalum]